MHAAMASRLASLPAVSATRADASTTAESGSGMPDDSGRLRSVRRENFGMLQVAADHGARVQIVLARLFAQPVEVDLAVRVARKCVAAAVHGEAPVAKLEASIVAMRSRDGVHAFSRWWSCPGGGSLHARCGFASPAFAARRRRIGSRGQRHGALSHATMAGRHHRRLARATERAFTRPGAAMESPPQIRFEDGASYETFMGVWSRLAGEQFLQWLAPPAGWRWADVGCGNGAFTELLFARCAPAEVRGIDPSPQQLAFARERLAHAAAQFVEGDAMALPWPDASFDAATTALVIFFVPDPAR